jgi:hypothetical protein
VSVTYAQVAVARLLLELSVGALAKGGGVWSLGFVPTLRAIGLFTKRRRLFALKLSIKWAWFLNPTTL